MTTEQDYRVAIGAYVLGGLESHEATELEAHIDGCTECQQELAEFTETAAQLELVPRDLLAEALEADQFAPSDTTPADDLVLQRTLRAIRAERAGVRRRRLFAVAAAVVALVAAPVITGLVVSDRGGGGTTIAQPPAPAGRTVRASEASGITGVATLTAAPWGTKVQARFTGEPRGATCQLFVVSTSGERELAGTWIVTDAAASGTGTNIQGSVSVKDNEIARLQVQTTTGRQLLTINA